MLTPQFILDINDEIIIDNFAGGGGASTGIEMALGRHVSIAINHDPKAVAMHAANHPQTEHYCESVWEVNPREVMPGRKVGLLWLSPDCKHHSKAKGGKPVEKGIRGLAWIALRWAAIRKPRVIMLENVEEFRHWGPLVTDSEGKSRPCAKRRGREFNSFKNALSRHGYEVEHKELRACDYGVPTIRNRLFLIARCDGQPIVWPEPTHGDPKSEAVKSGKLLPWATAADCIDWSIPCPSIFLSSKEAKVIGVKRPLVDATLRRVAKGMMRYVINSDDPFIITMAHGEGEGKTKRWGAGVRDIKKPIPTITASGGYGVVTPFISTYYGAKNENEVRGIRMDEPLHTQTTENRHAVVSAFLAKNYTGVIGSDVKRPIGTVTSIDHHSVVASNLVKLRGDNVGQATDSPLAVISAGGTHHAEVRTFLTKYSEGANDHGYLVKVNGELYEIADIGLRMLAPKELFLAQGFPRDYIFERGMVINSDGSIRWIHLTKTDQVRMCGNSVCPPLAAALVRANLSEMVIVKKRKAA